MKEDVQTVDPAILAILPALDWVENKKVDHLENEEINVDVEDEAIEPEVKKELLDETLVALNDNQEGKGVDKYKELQENIKVLNELDYITGDIVKALNTIGKSAVFVQPGTETQTAQEFPRLARRLNVLSQKTQNLSASIEIPGPFLESVDLGHDPEHFLSDWLRFANDKNMDLKNKISIFKDLSKDIINTQCIKDLLSPEDYNNFVNE